MTPGERLIEAMDTAKLFNRAEVARAAKVHPTTMGMYCRSERNPPLDVCERLGIVTRVSGRWLFDGTGPRERTDAPPPSIPDERIREIPLLDEVTAGRLRTPTSQIPVERVPLLAFADLGSGEFFALKVSGSSMDRVSPDGSIIVVNRSDRALINGRCYIFALDGETTYKRWQGGDPAYLDPFSTDPIHKPIFIRRKRDLEVIGRVKRTVLDL